MSAPFGPQNFAAPQAELLSPLGPAERPVPPWAAGETVETWVRRLALTPQQPVVVLLDGAPILRADWAHQAVPGERITALLLPAGGGGGSSKILRSIMMLAIAVAAAYTGGAAAAAIPGLLPFATTVVSTVVTTAITVAGGLLVNALFPAQAPKAQDQGAVSPTYSLQATGNMARLGQPIPRVYGRVRMVPDYAAQPFQEYVGDDQYLNQLFCLGLGQVELQQIQLDDTVLWRQELLRSAALSAETVPPSSGQAVDGWVAGSGGTISYTTVQERPAAVIGVALARHRIARSAVSGVTLSVRGLVEARSGAAATRLAIASLDGSGAELKRDEATLPAATLGQAISLRDVRIHEEAVWIEVTAGAVGAGNSVTISGLRLFEGGVDSSFDDVELQIVPPGEAMTLFPANVETSSEVGGQELLGSNQSGYDWAGPFAANQPGTLSNRLAVDLSWPMGLFRTNDSGGLEDATVTWSVQARAIDEEGTPLGSYRELGAHTLTRRSRRPLRQTYAYDVPPGRYEVRVRRGNAAGGTSYADTLIWDGLKAYLPGDTVWPDITLLALRLKATNQISMAASRRLGAVVQALIPVWDGEAWSPQPTRAIPWAFADVCRAAYGGGLADSRVDLEGLLTLEDTYATRGDRFDFVFDTRRSIWDALKLIGRAGRAQPVQVGSTITLRRDQPQVLAKAVFTPANILRGSFELQYVLQDDDSPNAVEGHYLDEETWQPETVLAGMPGSDLDAPQALDKEGIVNRPQAFRECIYEAASNERRRTFVSFDTELSGRLLIKGDLIVVNHDLPQWGSGGQAVSWDPETLTLRVDQALIWAESGTHYMSLRQLNGREWGPVKVTRGADDYELLLDEADHDAVETAQGRSADQVITVDLDREATHVVMGPGQQYIKRCLLLEARHRGHKTSILAVNEDEAVHTAELGSFPPPRVASLLPTRRAGPILEGLSVVIAPDAPAEAPVLEAAWRPSVDAEYYVAQRSSDGLTWTTVYEGAAAQAAIQVPPGTSWLRVAAFGTLRGPWSIWRADTEVGEEDEEIRLNVYGVVYNYNIHTMALAAGWNGTDPARVRVIVFNSVRVGSSSTATPAMRTGGDWPEGSEIVIENYGLIYGCAGKGGNGGNFGRGQNGSAGGDAFWNEGVTVTWLNYGSVAGGGGGGGGGDGKLIGVTSYAGGGGGGGQGESGGAGGSRGGSNATGGGAGAWNKRGNGGAGAKRHLREGQFEQVGGSGGRGGTLGQFGEAASAGGAGGQPGKAVRGDTHNTWEVMGARIGGIVSAEPS